MTTIVSNITGILEFVLGLGFLIFLHELGHFLVTKSFKIEVEEFGFGFPPRLVKLFNLGGTDFTLNWIPFGAFVRPKGESDISIPNGMASAGPWKRLAILLGGPAMNIITGILLFSLAFTLGGNPDPTNAHVQIRSTNPNSPAALAGLLPGDMVLSAANTPITDPTQLSQVIHNYLGKEITLVLQRGDTNKTVKITPRVTPPAGEGALGIVMSWYTPMKPVSLMQSIPLAVQEAYLQTSMTLSMPIKLIQGQISGDQARLVGPVGMYDIYQAVRTEDSNQQQADPNTTPVGRIKFLALIAVALGITNLLPIPALDGGQILLLLPELLFHKRVPQQYTNMVNLIGFAAVILLMIAITAQDFIHPIPLN